MSCAGQTRWRARRALVRASARHSVIFRAPLSLPHTMLAILRMSCRPDHLLALRKYATTKAPYLTSRSPLTSQREIHSTPRTAAQHSTNPLVNSPLMQKLQNSPEALSAISNMLDIMRQEGRFRQERVSPGFIQCLCSQVSIQRLADNLRQCRC